ncbi:MAG: hypothetical protein ACWGOX_14250 [Desulforhopalus sp.]
MIVNCPHCKKQLKLSEKIRESIQDLEPGRKIKLKCVHCAVPFNLEAKNIDIPERQGSILAKKKKREIPPPAPPAVDWLREGAFKDEEVVEDIPRAMVLMPDSQSREIVVKAAADFGYLVEQAASPEEAIEKMQFVNFAAVFLHNDYEPEGIETGKFHQFMRQMNMSRRRYIFYVLIGEQFRTLYDLQALAYSANVVVNDSESAYIGTILRKTIPEYESLFGPLMEELRVAGKQ